MHRLEGQIIDSTRIANRVINNIVITAIKYGVKLENRYLTHLRFISTFLNESTRMNAH